MFIRIETNNMFTSEGNDSLIQKIEEEYFLNTNNLIQIEFSECFIKKTFFNKVIEFENLIKLYVLVDEGVWNFMTLYFTNKNYDQFQRIKRIIQNKE